MSQFSFNEYNATVTAAQNRGPKAKVGYFKLSNDGDMALVRINASSLDDLYCASVHTISYGGRWAKVSCLNTIGTKGRCELCAAAEAGNKAVSVVSKRVYIPMLVSYYDKTTGQWSAPLAVIWDRPIAYAKEIMNKLRDFGDLRQVLLKVTRNGVARDLKTTYSLEYAMPTVYKDTMVPADFSAFTNFKINKHSFWEKTPEEIHTFITTGVFPETAINTDDTSDAAVAEAYAAAQQPVTAAPVQQAPQTGYVAPTQQSYTAVNQAVQPQVEPQVESQAEQPAKKFNGFHF